MGLLRRAMFPFAKRFVAGESVSSAVRRARELNGEGVIAYINLLGEHVEERRVAEEAQEEYLRLLERMDEEGLEAGISVKLTHLGLKVDSDFCRENLELLVEKSGGSGRYVWIDMESSDHTDDTIEMYRELRQDHTNVGVCIQAYLKRSLDDAESLLEDGGEIRLVKGAYSEPADVAYRDREDINENFREILQRLFDSDTYFAIATHDENLVKEAKKLAGESGRGKDEFEFQFLLGVKENLAGELVGEGYRVAEYVPYGPEWLSYYWRRVRERKENLLFALKAVLR